MNMIDFVHIGLNKTGTTYLQNGLFANHPELQVFGSSKFPGKNNLQLYKIINYLNKCSSLYFDENYFSEYMTNMISAEKSENHLLGISAEGLSGGWRDGKNVRFIAETLKSEFGNLKIIITLREQVSMLESNYNQFIRRGGIVSFEECFFSPFYGGGMLTPDSFYETNVISYFKYSRIVKLYQDVFGQSNVKVLFYEDLKESPSDFAASICDFLKISALPETCDTVKKNESLCNCSLNFIKLGNRLFCTKFNQRNGKAGFLSRLIQIKLKSDLSLTNNVEFNRFLLRIEIDKRLQRKFVLFVQKYMNPIFKKICGAKADNISTIALDKKIFLEKLYGEDNKALCKLLNLDADSLQDKGYLIR